MLKTGTVVDASIITAPSSTKNKDGQRDPEMHQTKKGNQWHFGMKVHIGVDAQSGLVHSVIGTATNVNDVTQASAQLHGDEEVVFADSGYQGAHNRPEAKPGVTLHIARRPSSRKPCEKSGLLGELIDKAEHLKASVRAKVEHPFRVIKQQFGYAKTRYRGLDKNTARRALMFALSNLWRVRCQTMTALGRVRLQCAKEPQ